MAESAIESFVKLRVLVAALGEKPCEGWWDSSFLDDTGLRYLTFSFPRTARLAAIQGATEAACRVHDEHIGKRGSAHLFRLPYEAELVVFERLRDQEKKRAEPLLALPQAKDALVSILREIAHVAEPCPEGPIFLGRGNPIADAPIIKRMAALYLGAFENHKRVYPFLESYA